MGNLSTLPEPLNYSRPSRMEGIPIPILHPLVDFGVTLSAHSVLSRLSSAFGAKPPDIYSLTNSRSATDAERRLAVRNKRRYTAYIYHLSHQSAVYSKNDTHYRAYSRGCDNGSNHNTAMPLHGVLLDPWVVDLPAGGLYQFPTLEFKLYGLACVFEVRSKMSQHKIAISLKSVKIFAPNFSCLWRRKDDKSGWVW